MLTIGVSAGFHVIYFQGNATIVDMDKQDNIRQR